MLGLQPRLRARPSISELIAARRRSSSAQSSSAGDRDPAGAGAPGDGDGRRGPPASLVEAATSRPLPPSTATSRRTSRASDLAIQPQPDLGIDLDLDDIDPEAIDSTAVAFLSSTTGAPAVPATSASSSPPLSPTSTVPPPRRLSDDELPTPTISISQPQPAAVASPELPRAPTPSSKMASVCFRPALLFL